MFSAAGNISQLHNDDVRQLRISTFPQNFLATERFRTNQSRFRAFSQVLGNKDAMSCPYELTTYKYVVRGNGQTRA